MNKIVFKPFWSYDVVKTEHWLSKMHSKGYALQKINFKARLFYFIPAEPAAIYYRIVFEKKSNGHLSTALIEGGFEIVCFSPDYYVIANIDGDPQITPSYNGFLSKNKKLKYIAGCILLFLIFFYVLPFMLISTIHANNILPPITSPVDTAAAGEKLFFIFFILSIPALLWLIYTFSELMVTNQELEKLCGDTLDLSLSIPKENLLSDEAEESLRKDKKFIRKIKIAWFYSPDKVEMWLEKMERSGYNLYRLSELGSRFFFIKGEPRKIKYNIDYQNKTDPQYFNLNIDSGWKLIYSSISKMPSINLWSQEYTQEIPQFYSDKSSKLKHAKRFALTYSLSFLPLCVLYLILTIKSISAAKNIDELFMINCFMFAVILLEYGSFAMRTILYYFRIKKRVDEE